MADDNRTQSAKTEERVRVEASGHTDEPFTEVIWRAVGAPIIFSWALASFLPIFALLMGGSPVRLLVEAAFLATGFVGLFGVWVFAKFAGGEGSEAPAASMLRGKAKPIRIYAAIWLTAYIFFGILRAVST